MLSAGAALFIAVAADVTHHGRLVAADEPIAAWLNEHAHPWLIMLASACSGLGDLRVLLPLGIVVGIWLIRQRNWRLLGIWSGGLLGSTVICIILKTAFAIPRPSRYTFYAFEPDSGYTFPSGHTIGAMVGAGLVTLLWMHLRPRPAVRRAAMVAAVAAMSLTVAAALVYLGVHWVTDVLAGLAVGLAWLGFLRLWLPPSYDKTLPSPGETHDGNPGKRQIDRPADSRTL
jgi:membrane-associated phospholipid phosphatase